MSGGQVEYRALVRNIVHSLPAHYDDPSLGVKPEPWRQSFQSDREAQLLRWKRELIMTEIVPFSFDTLSFEKYNGGQIKHPPEKYARVIPPNQVSGSVLAQPSRVSIAERNLEDFVAQQLGAIESGLRLVERQKSTPAGRLDLLCVDVHGNYVVVELKKTRGTDQVVGQLLRYMGWAKDEYPAKKVRGIVIVGRKDDALRYAIKAAPDIEVKEFTLSIG